jgi:phosphopantothenoylcysteine decarboxylase/phosphopantothenate--cysteine ligase
MQDLVNKKILLGISGGIAAYKTAQLVRQLTVLGAFVRVVMTDSAKQFITPMTLQALSGHEVRCDLFDSQAERAMGHIELARWADLLLIAPASANCLAKMAHGLADDLLSTIYLVAETPVFVCPAMNRAMWAHPATKHNCQLLLDRGVVMIGPACGLQACGETGYGRMSDVDDIIAALHAHAATKALVGHHVLITAGPTQEMIDPVRYISNRSSGKMGYALAKAALDAGAEVTLVTGPSAQPCPMGVAVYRVDTANAMFQEVMRLLRPGMIFIGAAAVGDYRVQNTMMQKLKKHPTEPLTVTLIPNPDILSHVAASGQALYVVGFAAETSNLLINASEKLHRKKLDMIIANTVGTDLGFEVDENEVTILTEHEQISLQKSSKTLLATEIIAIIAQKMQNAP